MTTHIDVEPLSNDNGKSLFRSQRIKLNGKEATTPLKALNPAKFQSSTRLDEDAFGFNEIYKSMTADKISTMLHNSSEHDSFARDLTNMTNRGRSEDLTICITKFSSKRPSSPFPNKKEIEVLTDVAHSASDITPLPIIDLKIDGSTFQKYMECMQMCHDTIEELNNKPIMGMLPNLPRELYPKLLEFYREKQIDSFCFDFNGQTPNHLKLRPIMRHLNTKKILDKTLIYGINAKPGRTLKNTNIIPSKDFIAYGFGLDLLGENHAPSRFRPSLSGSNQDINDKQKNKKRIFMRSDYGYYKTSVREDVSGLYPNDTRIRLDDILHGADRWQKLFNMEQQSLEANEIKKRLTALDRDETILTYIREKTQIAKEFRHLESGIRDISQQTLV